MSEITKWVSKISFPSLLPSPQPLATTSLRHLSPPPPVIGHYLWQTSANSLLSPPLVNPFPYVTPTLTVHFWPLLMMTLSLLPCLQPPFPTALQQLPLPPASSSVTFFSLITPPSVQPPSHLISKQVYAPNIYVSLFHQRNKNLFIVHRIEKTVEWKSTKQSLSWPLFYI